MATLIDLPDLPDLPGFLPDLPDLPAIGNPVQAIAEVGGEFGEAIGRTLEVLIDLTGNLVIATGGLALVVLGLRRIFGA